jgi:hypothetical protein
MDLTITQTLANFTALKWVVPHAGGAFPSIIDRFLTSQPVEVQGRSRAAYATRLWWDVAGPVFPRQIGGLLGYDVPVGQIVYGSVCGTASLYLEMLFLCGGKLGFADLFFFGDVGFPVCSAGDVWV